MLAFVIVLQVLVALFLIGVVLLQPGNRGGASAALGGAGSDTVFGGRGANTFLSKLTFGAAVCFMLTNIALSSLSRSTSEKSVLDALEHTTPKKAAPAATDNQVPATDGSGEAKPEANGEENVPAAEEKPSAPTDEAQPEQ